MSTIKSSAENLTLNADGANNDIIFQSNGSNVATLDQAGLLTATSFAGSGANLTGVGVDGIVSSADATAMTINSSEQVGIGTTPISTLSLGQTGGGNGNQLFFTYNGGSTDRSYSIGTNAYAWGELDIQASDANDTTIDRRILNVSRDGDVKINTGDLIFGTAGKGICLGVTSNTDANTLSDYEEGTWTPSLSVVPSGVTLGTVTTANYTKIGDRVFISMTCIILSSSDPAPTADMRMIGFPFANADASVIMPAVLNYNYKPTPQLMMNGNGYFYYQSTTVGGNNQEPVGSGLDDSSRLSLAIQYRTTA
jgi:hypothetical protein